MTINAIVFGPHVIMQTQVLARLNNKHSENRIYMADVCLQYIDFTVQMLGYGGSNALLY